MPLKDDWQDGDAFSADDMNDVATAVNDNTSAIAGKADAVHSHSAADITSGTLDIARIPTGNSAQTVCIGNDPRLSDTRTPTDNTVSTAKIQDGAVTEGKIASSAVTNGKLANSAVTDAKVAGDAAISVSKLGTGHVKGSANGTPTTLTVWVGSQAQYEAIGSPDSNTLYFTTE